MFTFPELLDHSFDVRAFDCGNAALNAYLTQYATQNIKKDAAKTFISCLSGTNRVVGYYTLVSGSVNPEESPTKVKKGLAKHPIPIVIIAKLAIDKKHQGKGLGKHLLKNALLRILQASEHIGIRAVHVYAKDETAMMFYKRYGFIESPVDEFSMFLLVKEFRALLT